GRTGVEAVSLVWAPAGMAPSVNPTAARPAMRYRPQHFESGRSIAGGRMDLGDVATGKLHDRDIAIADAIRVNQDGSAGFNGLIQRGGHVRHLVACHFAPVGVWQMPVGDEQHDLAEPRLDGDPSKCLVGAADLDAWRVLVV